jgi:hypothetical protein
MPRLAATHVTPRGGFNEFRNRLAKSGPEA